MTREEIENQMDELARKYVETHDPEIHKSFTYSLANLRKWKIRKALTGSRSAPALTISA
jgi:hypothetical protein